MNDNTAIVLAGIVVLLFFTGIFILSTIDNIYEPESEKCLESCNFLDRHQELECQLSCHKIFVCDIKNEVENGNTG